MSDKPKELSKAAKAPDLSTRIGQKNGPPAGRKKGSKNKSTLLREALQGQFDDMLQQKARQIFDVVADQALDGCRQSQKLILDRIVPTVHAVGDKDEKNKFAGGVTVVIGDLQQGKSVSVKPDIEDAEYDEI